jgi:hypothetical protein
MTHTYVAEEHVMYAVMSHNKKRGVASGIFCGSAPMLYDSTDQVSSISESSAAEYSGVKWAGWWAISYMTAAVQLFWTVAVRCW